MSCRTVTGSGEAFGVKFTSRSRNDRQERSGYALSADIKHGAGLFDLRKVSQPVGQMSKFGQGRFMKEVTLWTADADDAVAVGSTKPFTN